MKRTKVTAQGEMELWCRGCEQYLPIIEFKENLSEFGYSTKCFDCEIERSRTGEPINSQIVKVTNERERANEILIKLGYDIESPIPIYKQFERKHNL